MEQIAEESGDAFKINQSKRRVPEEIMPLLTEVDRTTQERQNGTFLQQEQQRAELFSGYRAPTLGGGQGSTDVDDMNMIIRNSEDLLRESQALCVETEETGAETLNMMEAKDILQAMSRKAIRNKLFLKGIIVLLILANFLVFMAKLKRKRRANP